MLSPGLISIICFYHILFIC